MTSTTPVPLDFEIGRHPRATVSYLHAQRLEIDTNPSYQRQGAIWSVAKQQLLIDSLINGFDIPKIYFHQFPVPKQVQGRKIRYALVDGKQRLEAVFDFLENFFPLSEDFVYLEDETVHAGGLTYRGLVEKYTHLISLLNATALDVVTIRTDDIELIEELFSRLNEAVPLNAAEKRNALGGPMPITVRDLARVAFFTERVPFNDTRYRHLDLATKFLYWEQQALEDPGFRSVRDVKKYRLDRFFRDMKDDADGAKWAKQYARTATKTLKTLSTVFTKNDRQLLSNVGMISIYYLLARRFDHDGRALPDRSAFVTFNDMRSLSRVPNEDALVPGQYQLLEFDRLSQSPNDGGALTFRLGVLDAFLTAQAAGDDPLDAVAGVGLAEVDQDIDDHPLRSSPST